MKLIAYLGILTIGTGLLIGCKKDSERNQPVASLRIINALIGGGNVKLNANERDSALRYNAKSFGLALVNNHASILVWPSGESGKPYYSKIIEAQDSDIFSLFLFGWHGNVESMLIKEQIPSWNSDSVVGIRIAHLAQGIGGINITLKKDPTTPIFRQISYKTVSDIAKIPLPRVIPAGSASFEVRDAVNDKLLTTYTLPASVNSLYPGISVALQRFKNITLVIKGSRDTLSGPNTFGVFPVAMSY